MSTSFSTEFEEAEKIREITGKSPRQDLNIYWNKAMDKIDERNYNDFFYYSEKAEQRAKRIIEAKESIEVAEEVGLCFNSARVYAKRGNWSIIKEIMNEIKGYLKEYGMTVPAVTD